MAVLLWLCGVQTLPAAEALRLASGEWPPYFSADFAHFGVGSRIVTESFALEGISVTYGFFPWKRALELAAAGAWDGTLGWELSPERERLFCASDRVWTAPWVLFHRASMPLDWTRFEDLRRLRIGGTLGYLYSPELFAAEQAGLIRVERTGSDALNFRKLASGRLDVFPQLIDIGELQLRRLFDARAAARITYHPKPLGLHSDHLLLSRKRPESAALIQVFNRGLARLKSSGAYDRYFEESRAGVYDPSGSSGEKKSPALDGEEVKESGGRGSL